MGDALPGDQQVAAWGSTHGPEAPGGQGACAALAHSPGSSFQARHAARTQGGAG